LWVPVVSPAGFTIRSAEVSCLLLPSGSSDSEPSSDEELSFPSGLMHGVFFACDISIHPFRLCSPAVLVLRVHTPGPCCARYQQVPCPENPAVMVRLQPSRLMDRRALTRDRNPRSGTLRVPFPRLRQQCDCFPQCPYWYRCTVGAAARGRPVRGDGFAAPPPVCRCSMALRLFSFKDNLAYKVIG
jgi:hypothetical protein